MENLRTVVFMADQKGNGEDLYRCKETGKVYIRQESGDDDHVRWLTASKWTGGYEADCPMKEGLILRAVGRSGNVLFEEKLIKEEGVADTWAVKEGPFSWEAICAMADEMAKQHGLHSYEEWKTWLLADMPADSKTYYENWLFAMADRQPLRKLDRMEFLGITAFATSQEEKHTACGKIWTSFEIRDAGLTDCLAICGYKYE